MKKYLLGVVMMTSLALGSCSKVGDPEPTKPEEHTLSKVSLDRSSVGAKQLVQLSVEIPQWAGDVITYKWVFTNPEGKSTDVTNSNNKIEFSPLLVGEYTVKVFLSSKGIESSSETKFQSVPCDFGLGIFGDSKQVIINAKSFAGESAETGLLSEIYWPFTAEKPDDWVKFKTGNYYETYMFIKGKLIGGSKEIINEPFSMTTNGVQRNLSYYTFANYVLDFNKITKIESAPVLEWKSSLTEDRKLRYETIYSTKFDGYGWALMNRDMTQVTANWSSNAIEAKGYLKSMGNNSLYEIHITVRKK